MDKATKHRIKIYIFCAVWFLIGYGIWFILEKGNLIIEDVPGTPQKVETKYRPSYDPTKGEK